MSLERENIGGTKGIWETLKKTAGFVREFPMLYVKNLQERWVSGITDFRYQQQSHRLFQEFKRGLQDSSSTSEDLARYARYNNEVDDLWMKTYFIGKPPKEQSEILAAITEDIETAQNRPMFQENDDTRQDLETDIRLAMKMRNSLIKESNK